MTGGLLHRIDFNQRLTRICLGSMMFQCHFLTKLQYNLVSSTDRPPIDDAYENFQSLYGPAITFERFADSWRGYTGCLVSAKDEPQHQMIPASGSLVYSHSSAVTAGHGFRHSIVIKDVYNTERKSGVTDRAKQEKKANKHRLDRYKASLETYRTTLATRDPISSIRNLYRMQLPLTEWDDKFENFTYVKDERKKRVAVKYNRVKHTVIALRGCPLYCHDTEFGTYDGDYCAFSIPTTSIQVLLPQMHQHLLNSIGYEIKDMITAGMQRINGNDNLLCFPEFQTCEELFTTRFGNCVPENEVDNLAAEFTKAVREGCEVALLRKIDGSFSHASCSIKVRLQCNVPDLTKTTMECKRTAYPLPGLQNANQQGVAVLSGILPLHDAGFVQQAYNGEMKTSAVKFGTRFLKDNSGFRAFRGLPVFIAPDSFVLYPASLPVACGIPVDPGISYFLELDIQIARQVGTPPLPLTSLGERAGIDCYLTSGGPAMSFFTDDASVQKVKQILDVANKHMGETCFEITKNEVLPSVVYWSKHGEKTKLGMALRDQIDPSLEILAQAIWFGNFEHLAAENRPRLGQFSLSEELVEQLPQEAGMATEPTAGGETAIEHPLHEAGTATEDTADGEVPATNESLP